MSKIVAEIPPCHIFEINGLDGSKVQYIKLHLGSVGYVVDVADWKVLYQGQIELSTVVNWHKHIQELIPLNLLKVISSGIDWQLLRQQKAWLFEQSRTYNARDDKDNRIESNNAEGLLSLLDSLMDAVVADNLATNIEVFGKDI